MTMEEPVDFTYTRLAPIRKQPEPSSPLADLYGVGAFKADSEITEPLQNLPVLYPDPADAWTPIERVVEVKSSTLVMVEQRSIEEPEAEFISLDFDDAGNPPDANDDDPNINVTGIDGINDACSSGSDDDLKIQVPPWVQCGISSNGVSFHSALVQLHQEIIDFCDFISPTQEEEAERVAAIERVVGVIRSIWPNCEVKIFGSFATGLYLPSSDVDMVILNSGCHSPQNGLKALAKAFTRRSMVKKIQVIAKARVPIVKFVEGQSGISFDISFDMQNGPEAADFIKESLHRLPPLRPLCLVLKIFLQQRELNEVFTGGIGSYALLVMLLTHLQVHPSRQLYGRLEENLGVLLLDFFALYGRALNVRDVGVSCRDGGRFFSKSLKGFRARDRPFLLSVEDPQAPDNDIGKNSYNIQKVRSAFLLAHRALSNFSLDAPAHVGVLGRIIRADYKLFKRRSVLGDGSSGCPPAPVVFGDNLVSLDGGDDFPRHHHEGDFPRYDAILKGQTRKQRKEEQRAAQAKRKAGWVFHEEDDNGYKKSKTFKRKAKGPQGEKTKSKKAKKGGSDEPVPDSYMPKKNKRKKQASGEGTDMHPAFAWEGPSDGVAKKKRRRAKAKEAKDDYTQTALSMRDAKKRVITTATHKKIRYL